MPPVLPQLRHCFLNPRALRLPRLTARARIMHAGPPRCRIPQYSGFNKPDLLSLSRLWSVCVKPPGLGRCSSVELGSQGPLTSVLCATWLERAHPHTQSTFWFGAGRGMRRGEDTLQSFKGRLLQEAQITFPHSSLARDGHVVRSSCKGCREL